jgi:two-component system chemotaxis sensor kinase CheA
VLANGQPIDELLEYYESTNLTLISATAALSQLAEDSELLRAISALVVVLQITERASQEHALLSHVFTINEFPAGTYKDLVALTTEEAIYVNMLNVGATDRVNQRFRDISRAPEFKRAAELRKVALDTIDDAFHVMPEEWSTIQSAKIERLRGLELELTRAIQSAAIAKITAAGRSVRLSYGLTGSVLLVSVLLAGLIARGISRSVRNLTQAAEQVSQQKKFGIRAVKTSDDELGRLTDTWNDMLAGIQARDEQLRQHQENLERLVELRTEALRTRNQAMRLVLDNVDQGLATIKLDGTLSPERSRAFDDWFGDGEAQASFADRLARGDARVSANLKVSWEQVADGILPVECSIDQMPRQIAVDGRHYELGYKVIMEEDRFRGVLLVVSDVTSELMRKQRDAEQRELIAVFERFVRDRGGFNEFFREAESLVHQVVAAKTDSLQATLRALHTLKGNCSTFGVESVVTVAHELEQSILDSGSTSLQPEQIAELGRVWHAFAGRILQLSGREAESVLELSHDELRELEAAVETRVPHTKLAELLSRLRSERGIVRLRRVAEQAKALARRLGKGELDVQIEASSEVRMQAEQWSSFWSSFVHVVRNAIDHGIELPAARVTAGKPERPQLKLSANSDARALTIEISDDGRGVDWAKVRDKAKERGLPSESQRDLVDALFSDGLSTAASVTEFSGRGVGMSAVRHAASQLGGVVSVTSTSGHGTTVRFRFPIVANISRSSLSTRSG